MDADSRDEFMLAKAYNGEKVIIVILFRQNGFNIVAPA